jgi:phosphohistidine swiveling domain-containing protein
LQDKRKEVISKTNSLFVKACNKLLDFYGVSIMEREKIMISAFPTWFCDFDIEEIRQKTEESYICYFLPSDDRKVLSGLKALDVLKKIEEDIISKNSILEVKGQTAFKGKIKGIVRIVIKSEDFSKFTDGEILVTHMTRPEFVPLMKKASAIITDEGGITCHAAIVARELSKPCIIGTKNATQILKDGDLVEVDADNGVVRIIKDDKGQSDNKYILSKEVENIINKNLYNFRDDVYGVSDNWSFFLNEFVFNCLNKYQDRICFHDNKGGFLGFLNTEDSKKIARDE